MLRLGLNLSLGSSVLNYFSTPGSRKGVSLNTLITSRKVFPQIAGSISVSGLEYELNNSGIWTNVSDTITENDFYRVRLTSSENYMTTVNGIVTIDTTDYTFTVMTMDEPPVYFDTLDVSEIDTMLINEIDETIF